MAEALFAGTYTLQYEQYHTADYQESQGEFVVLNNSTLFNAFYNTNDYSYYKRFTIPCKAQVYKYDEGDYSYITYSFDGLAILTDYAEVYKQSQSSEDYSWYTTQIPIVRLAGYRYQQVSDGDGGYYYDYVYTSITNNGFDSSYDQEFYPTRIILDNDATLTETLATDFLKTLFTISTTTDGGSTLYPMTITFSDANNGLTLATENTIIKNNIVIKMDETSLANLIPSNIAEGITIMGVTGTWAGWGETITVSIEFYSYVSDEEGIYSKELSTCSGSYIKHAATSVESSFTSQYSLTITIPKAGSIEIYIKNYDDNDDIPGEGFAFINDDTCFITKAASAKTWILSEFTANTSLTFTTNSY